jgi:hypothetical protein
VYGTNVYENGEEKQEQSVVVDEGEEEEDKVQHFQPKVRKEDVWREIIITSVGRDKAFVSFLKKFMDLVFSLMLVSTCKRN